MVPKVEVPDDYRTTREVKVPEKIVDQVVGQENAVEIVKKASLQKRNVLLIGLPGTGKSMLAQAMAELLPISQLHDTLIYPNDVDPNTPKVRVVRASEGKKLVNQARLDAISAEHNIRMLGVLLPMILLISSFVMWRYLRWFGDIVYAALLIIGAFFLIISGLGFQLQSQGKTAHSTPKLLVDNSGKKMAPFIEATGARAGALLGDVRHDPLQTFFPDTVVYKIEDNVVKPKLLKDVADELLERYKADVERSVPGYEGLILPANEELYILGKKEDAVQPVRVHIVNKRQYSGEMTAVNTNGKQLIVTPEHQIYANESLVEASKLSGSENFVIHEQPVLTESDIIQTFSFADQVAAQKYYRYLAIKAAHPDYGYKRLAKLLNAKEGQVRWWHTIGSKPKAVQTIDWLKERNLLPLTLNDPRITAIARVLGSTFGDGGIFATLNAIFLSSAESSSLREFGQDLISIFGEEILQNFDIRTSGINKSAKSIWNTNRAVIRFFAALGAPVGRKNKAIQFPAWIQLSEVARQNFFGAFLGNELCSPKFTDKYKYLNTLDVALAGSYSLKENRHRLLGEMRNYLASYGINCGQIYENEFRPSRFLWKLCISKDIENFSKFLKLPIYYSKNKVKRLQVAFEKMKAWKLEKYNDMIARGKSANYISTTMRVSNKFMQMLLRSNELVITNKINYTGTIYNLTTDSGNLFANGILAKNSGGLGTPAHLRVEPGMIHRANGGVLFIDEIATLSPKSQQELLTAMQEKKYSITGQSEMSSGAMTRTEAVPCDFVLVAAGNYFDLAKVHPALRSRMRGYGYEIYLNQDMPDTEENRKKIVQFVAQEVKKDGKVPHFSREAVEQIIFEARRRVGKKNSLTMNLRDLGGLVRAAGDIAKEKSHEFVEDLDVLEAKMAAKTLEQQMMTKVIEDKKAYDVYITEGSIVGRVNGLAVLADGDAGLVLPIEAQVAPAASKAEGKLIATGKLGEIAKEAVQNVSAIVKRLSGKDISMYDLHIQFLQTYQGVEGDSASVSVATAVVSAMEGLPVKQDIAMTGSLSVRGEVLPVGGVTAKVEAAIKAGFKEVIIPKANLGDVILSKDLLKKVKLVPVANLQEVLDYAFIKSDKKAKMLDSLKKILSLGLVDKIKEKVAEELGEKAKV